MRIYLVLTIPISFIHKYFLIEHCTILFYFNFNSIFYLTLIHHILLFIFLLSKQPKYQQKLQSNFKLY